jgi:single-strand DNA-binding protein
MLNRVILVGNLTRDPELRYTSNGGVAVVRFTVAVNRKFTNQQGEREADFINIVAWRALAENCGNYLKKGSLVAIEGRIQTRSYENQEGRTVYVTEVVADDVRFLSSRNRTQSQYGQPENDHSKGMMDDPFADDGSPIDISDDDLPF